VANNSAPSCTLRSRRRRGGGGRRRRRRGSRRTASARARSPSASRCGSSFFSATVHPSRGSLPSARPQREKERRAANRRPLTSAEKAGKAERRAAREREAAAAALEEEAAQAAYEKSGPPERRGSRGGTEQVMRDKREVGWRFTSRQFTLCVTVYLALTVRPARSCRGRRRTSGASRSWSRSPGRACGTRSAAPPRRTRVCADNRESSEQIFGCILSQRTRISRETHSRGIDFFAVVCIARCAGG
jgi:hypothetical protein